MKIYKLFSEVFIVLFLVCNSANATLIDRGNGMYYDDDRDITWLQKESVTNVRWAEANEWANSLVYGGFDNWRLPHMPQTDPTCISVATIDFLKFQDCTAGEMGHLFYTELGNSYAPTARDINSNNYEPFAFVRSNKDGNWTSTRFDSTVDWPTDTGAMIPANENYHWLFYFVRGIKYVFSDGNRRSAMAVRDGDVVPTDSSGTLNDDLSFHSPSLDFQSEGGLINIWANLSRYGTGPNNEQLWGLTAFGINKTAFTGSMTGEVSESLHLTIHSLHFQDTSYWVSFKYFGIDNETHLWALDKFGENPIQN